MRTDDNRRPRPRALDNRSLHSPDADRIQSRERFIEIDYARRMEQTTGDHQLLLHPAREFAGKRMAFVDKLEFLQQLSPNGFDYVIEATGSATVCEEALQFVRRRGTLLVYGVYPEKDTARFNPFDLFRGEISIKGSFAQVDSFGRALAYLESGRIKVDEIVTDEVLLSDYQRQNYARPEFIDWRGLLAKEHETSFAATAGSQHRGAVQCARG